jgi:6-phosphogluconolactonase
METHAFDTKDQLERQLITDVFQVLQQSILERGTASILFSGGSTPKGFLEKLTAPDFNWKKVKVGLVDDRMVLPSESASNANMIKSIFLEKIDGPKPTFCTLVKSPDNDDKNMEHAMRSVEQIGVPDVVILGMGTDGHFASLFPGDSASTVGLITNFDAPLIYTMAPSQPTFRISHTWAFLRKSRFLFLHLTGEAKLDIINEHSERKNPLPIDTVLRDEDVKPVLYWAP